MRRPVVCAAAAALFAFALPTLLRAAACAVNPGGRVVLASDAVDPDVFVWDDSERLINFAAGRWDTTRSILQHTTLVPPGTKAIVVTCLPASEHPRYSSDAVRVKMTSGPFRGKFGWVLPSDLHSYVELKNVVKH